MRKLLTIALLLVGMTASAQKTGEWLTGMNEADELKGQKAGPYYLYEEKSMGSFCVWDWDDWVFRINSNNGPFDVWYYERSGFRFMKATIGLYDMNGNLIKGRETELAASVDGCSGWINKNGMYMPATRKFLRKAIGALKSGEGYVRVVCARKGVPEFDLKVMPYKTPDSENVNKLEEEIKGEAPAVSSAD